MNILWLFIPFLILLFLNVPVAYSLGMSSLVYILVTHAPIITVAQKMYAGTNTFVLLCIPGFVLAGNLMNVGGITKRIINFCNVLVGHISGGLSIANVGSSMVFAGISGTAVADAASIGGIMIPAMADAGYEIEYSAAVTAASSTLGPIIPPSVPMIIAGTLTGISVGTLFVAGALPGFLLALFQMILCYVIAKKRNYPKSKRQPLSVIFKVFLDGFWSVLMTVIILVCILGGIATPTEASIIAVLYAIFIGMFIYKELKVKDLKPIFLESIKSSASIMLLVAFASVFAFILASEKVPQAVAHGILSISSNKFIVLILINLLLLFVGTFMETISAIVILFPVLLGVTRTLGINDAQFAVMAVLNLVIGLTTPPVGICLFVCSGIAGISLSKISKAILPFLLVSLLVLALVTFVPAVSLFLPNLLGL